MNKKYILKYFFIYWSAMFLLLVSGLVFANASSSIEVDNLRVILPPSVARSTSIYGVIKNTGSVPDTLIGLETNAGMIMLHKTDIKNGMAQMNHLDSFVLEPGAELVLKPMSYHLMLMNINHKIIKKGGEITLILEFLKAGKVEFKVPVSLE